MFFNLFIFNWRIIVLLTLKLVFVYISTNHPYVYICSLPLEPPPTLPPHPIPMLSQSIIFEPPCFIANSHQLAINILHMVMYIVPMLLSQFVPSSPSPLCSQVCSLCLRLHWVLFLKLFVLREKIEPIDIIKLTRSQALY